MDILIAYDARWLVVSSQWKTRRWTLFDFNLLQTSANFPLIGFAVFVGDEAPDDIPDDDSA